MVFSSEGPKPLLPPESPLPELAWHVCPGKGIDYPYLYKKHYGVLPDDWRIGCVDKLWVGHAEDPSIRLVGASGGVTTAVLIYLLQQGLVDAAILVKQGYPTPEQASWVIATNETEVIEAAQSVYIPVSVLDALNHLEAGKRYAMTLLPEQSAALRVLQHAGHAAANQIKYVLGPYTGTALSPKAIRALLRSKGVSDQDAITSLRWRAGEWPGYLEIRTRSGKIVQSKKVYYNFLIPFYVTQTSLQSMDFANEFTDLSVGDAWSPKYEAMGQGFSVVVSRSPAMTKIIQDMSSSGLLALKEEESVVNASAMHGHMIDFKKRGGYLRNRWRLLTGRSAPDYGIKPTSTPFSRILVEMVISSIFAVGRTRFARWTMEQIPESVLGPVFNRLRLLWKSASKPAKRKGLKSLTMQVYTPKWKQ